MSAESFAKALAQREVMRDAILHELEQERRRIVSTRFSDPSVLLELAAVATREGNDQLAGFYSDLARAITQGEYDPQAFLDKHPQYNELEVPLDYGHALPEMSSAVGLLEVRSTDVDGGLKPNLADQAKDKRIDVGRVLTEQGIVNEGWVRASAVRRLVVIPKGQNRVQVLQGATLEAKRQARESDLTFESRGQTTGTEYSLRTAVFLLNSFVNQGLTLNPEVRASKKKGPGLR